MAAEPMTASGRAITCLGLCLERLSKENKTKEEGKKGRHRRLRRVKVGSKSKLGQSQSRRRPAGVSSSNVKNNKQTHSSKK